MFLTAGSAMADEANAELMDRIEGVVELPASAAPLSEYRRYYSWAKKGGRSWCFMPWATDRSEPGFPKARCRSSSTKGAGLSFSTSTSSPIGRWI